MHSYHWSLKKTGYSYSYVRVTYSWSQNICRQPSWREHPTGCVCILITWVYSQHSDGKRRDRLRFLGCRKRRKKVKVPNYARASVRAAMTKNRRKNGNFQRLFTDEPPFLIYCKQTDLRICSVLASCEMLVFDEYRKRYFTDIKTNFDNFELFYLLTWYWTQMILNYFTFLPANLILNSYDF